MLITSVFALVPVAATVVIAAAVVPTVVVSVVLAVNVVLAVFVVLMVFVVVMVRVAGHAVIGHVAVRSLPVVNAVGRVAVVAVCIGQRKAVRLGRAAQSQAGKTECHG
jgi:hypothetical protein